MIIVKEDIFKRHVNRIVLLPMEKSVCIAFMVPSRMLLKANLLLDWQLQDTCVMVGCNCLSNYKLPQDRWLLGSSQLKTGCMFTLQSLVLIIIKTRTGKFSNIQTLLKRQLLTSRPSTYEHHECNAIMQVKMAFSPNTIFKLLIWTCKYTTFLL